MIAITGATGQLGQHVITTCLTPRQPANWLLLCVTRLKPKR